MEEKYTSTPIGSRGKILAVTPFLPYKDAFLKCLQDPFDIDRNPQGYISLCVAENKLVLNELSHYLSQPQIATIGFASSPQNSFCYNNFMGLTPIREAVISFLTRKFIMTEDSHHHVDPKDSPTPPTFSCTLTTTNPQRLQPEHVVIGSGCAGLLNVLFCLLTDVHDAVLIPAPYYAAFDNDMKAIARCIPIPVTMNHDGSNTTTTIPTTCDLERAKQEAESKGLQVKILLLTNPHNPYGVIYDSTVIRSCIEWARSHGMHTIVDEIYALSVHDSTNTKFQSVLKIMDNDGLGDDIHMLWALSKDFGSSGLRLGVLYTQNNMLLKAIETISAFSSVSHPIQMIAAHMLTDVEFVDTFLDTSRERLSASYNIVIQSLENMSIPYVPAEAGIFVYCDFSSLLPENTFAGEAIFASFLVDVGRVVMTPGESQHDSRPGFFRICYAAIIPEALKVAMKRISSIVDFFKLRGWEQARRINCYEDILIALND